ncbi:hypothetical protein TSUD_137640 [Trifolium subterraneum]|uniref:TatD related DNase n=1 Tax=Trifolium subterraneum TaxID=3900 RepID=A0A2Z6NZL2_TRISU|nr:hypothetical protein TSUD_137640 [Trifolium subterraneum]
MFANEDFEVKAAIDEIKVFPWKSGAEDMKSSYAVMSTLEMVSFAYCLDIRGEFSWSSLTCGAALRRIGLDKGSQGKKIDFSQQVEVLRQQLELARELNKPASVHCVRAYGDLLELMKLLKYNDYGRS